MSRAAASNTHYLPSVSLLSRVRVSLVAMKDITAAYRRAPNNFRLSFLQLASTARCPICAVSLLQVTWTVTAGV
jgi:hypothetical protein